MSEQTDKQARLDALRKARDSGVLIVRHGDTMTEFRSLSAISQIIRDIESEISILAGKTRRKVRYIYQPSKGL